MDSNTNVSIDLGDKSERIANAFAKYYGYQAKITQNQERTETVPENTEAGTAEYQQTITEQVEADNPQSRHDFMQDKIKDFINNIVVEQEKRDRTEAAEQSVSAPLS